MATGSKKIEAHSVTSRKKHLSISLLSDYAMTMLKDFFGI
jgi:hypothetical protein